MEKVIKTLTFIGKAIIVMYDDNTTEEVLVSSLSVGIDTTLLNKVFIILSVHNK